MSSVTHLSQRKATLSTMFMVSLETEASQSVTLERTTPRSSFHVPHLESSKILGHASKSSSEVVRKTRTLTSTKKTGHTIRMM